MDNWFNLNEFENILKSEFEHMFPVYWWRYSQTEYVYFCFFPVSRRYSYQALAIPDFDLDRSMAKKSKVLNFKKGGGRMDTTINKRFYPNSKPSPSNNIEVSHVFEEASFFTERKISLTNKSLYEDLNQKKLNGLLCMQVFRYSERDLNELGLSEERGLLCKGDDYCYTKSIFKDCETMERMNSISMLRGKKLYDTTQS